jgi:hypothetical protein
MRCTHPRVTAPESKVARRATLRFTPGAGVTPAAAEAIFLLIGVRLPTALTAAATFLPTPRFDNVDAQAAKYNV